MKEGKEEMKYITTQQKNSSTFWASLLLDFSKVSNISYLDSKKLDIIEFLTIYENIKNGRR